MDSFFFLILYTYSQQYTQQFGAIWMALTFIQSCSGM